MDEAFLDRETDTDPIRLPGLYRAWELGQIMQPGCSYRIEAAGATVEGTPVFAVYASEDGTDPGELGQ